jgi:hypothetical protein
MIDPRDVQTIDAARVRGLTYDQVVAHLVDGGLVEHDAHQVLEHYMKVVDSGGMPRSQVNPGDPGRVA